MRVWLKPGRHFRPSTVAPRKIVCLEAEAAAKKALSLDDDSADAFTVLTSIKALYYYDFAGGADRLRTSRFNCIRMTRQPTTRLANDAARRRRVRASVRSQR